MRHVVTVGVAIAVLATGCGGLSPSPAPTAARTTVPTAVPGDGGVVSLTFDDGLARQEQMAQELTERGLTGTFYVHSTRTKASGYLDQPKLARLAQAGHEIGGHTRTHARLPELHPDEQRREVCADRSGLEAMGFTPRSFAYPFHAVSAAAESVVRECGYNSGRGRAGAAAERIKPRDPYNLNTPLAVGASTTPAEIQQYVIAAEQRKTWAILVFHDYCDDCGPLGVKPAVFTGFLDWLKGREIPVRTVGDVIGGDVRPVPQIKAPSIVLNASLENYFGKEGIPDCWQLDGRSKTATFGRVAGAHTGRWAGRIQVTGGDPKQLRLAIKQDDGDCAPRAGALSVWYTSTAPVRFTVSRRTGDGVWTPWADGPVFPATTSWRQATWKPPAARAAGVSFGLVLTAPGQATFDDFALR
ncbi:polysaccharide deacetylase family protein [Nonomuraea zeae]|uniref:polysaccharide deacetylase family protein n=1 Tax=Nonomuraea zeae TaxID=1642303 RepID=UPI0014785305|nr:polysaccharide deacetylase family protein [Nonomuraea zeae]